VKAGMTKTGPNDASGVVWALGEFFFSIFVFFYIKLILYYVYRLETTTWRATKMKTGPNNARCVVWAISKFFFSFVFHQD
jgi:amino acid permease